MLSKEVFTQVIFNYLIREFSPKGKENLTKGRKSYLHLDAASWGIVVHELGIMIPIDERRGPV